MSVTPARLDASAAHRGRDAPAEVLQGLRFAAVAQSRKTRLVSQHGDSQRQLAQLEENRKRRAKSGLTRSLSLVAQSAASIDAAADHRSGALAASANAPVPSSCRHMGRAHWAWPTMPTAELCRAALLLPGCTESCSWSSRHSL